MPTLIFTLLPHPSTLTRLPDTASFFLTQTITFSCVFLHVNDVVTDWSYALIKFLVSSLFRAFIFLAILATFTLQMFFSFDAFKCTYLRPIPIHSNTVTVQTPISQIQVWKWTNTTNGRITSLMTRDTFQCSILKVGTDGTGRETDHVLISCFVGSNE